MRLRYIILCDNAFTDPNGRLNIIQTFDIITTTDIPAIKSNMSIVTRWDFEEGDDKEIEHNQKIVILNNSGGQVIPPLERKLKATTNKSKYLQFIANLQGMRFNELGKYKIKVFMDDQEGDDEEIFEVKKEFN